MADFSSRILFLALDHRQRLFYFGFALLGGEGACLVMLRVTPRMLGSTMRCLGSSPEDAFSPPQADRCCFNSGTESGAFAFIKSRTHTFIRPLTKQASSSKDPASLGSLYPGQKLSMGLATFTRF